VSAIEHCPPGRRCGLFSPWFGGAEIDQKIVQKTFHARVRRLLFGHQTGCVPLLYKGPQQFAAATDHVNRHGPGTTFAGDLNIGLMIAHDDYQGVTPDKLSQEKAQNG
jgi:hypothetical protein